MSLDPMAGVTNNSYSGDHVNMAAMEAQAWKRAARGETTKIHYHTYLQTCTGYEHTVIGPEDLKNKEADSDSK